MTFTEHAVSEVLKRLYDIPAQKSPHARRTIAACAAVATELARAAHTLHRIGETDLAASCVRYASEVTDMACEYARKSAEIEP